MTLDVLECLLDEPEQRDPLRHAEPVERAVHSKGRRDAVGREPIELDLNEFLDRSADPGWHLERLHELANLSFDREDARREPFQLLVAASPFFAG